MCAGVEVGTVGVASGWVEVEQAVMNASSRDPLIFANLREFCFNRFECAKVGG